MGDSASIGRGIRAKISGVVRSVVALAADNVINATPVDTGHAASNWIITFGSPFNGVVGSRDAVDWGPERDGIAMLGEYDVGRDGVVYLRNNVFYLKYLDRGSSQQAPADFVATALMGGARLAPHGFRGRVQKMLRTMAKTAYKRGQRP